MVFTAIIEFEVRNGMEDEVRETFRNRPGLVVSAEGFVGSTSCLPKINPAEFWLITHWKDEACFHYWHKHHRSKLHQNTKRGL